MGNAALVFSGVVAIDLLLSPLLDAHPVRLELNWENHVSLEDKLCRSCAQSCVIGHNVLCEPLVPV